MNGEDANRAAQNGVLWALDGLIEGRIVHYVPWDPSMGKASLRHLAAVVVRVWKGSGGIVNLAVFPDGGNDSRLGDIGDPMIVWRTSVKPFIPLAPDGEFQHHTWHWPERR